MDALRTTQTDKVAVEAVARLTSQYGYKRGPPEVAAKSREVAPPTGTEVVDAMGVKAVFDDDASDAERAAAEIQDVRRGIRRPTTAEETKLDVDIVHSRGAALTPAARMAALARLLDQPMGPTVNDRFVPKV